MSDYLEKTDQTPFIPYSGLKSSIGQTSVGTLIQTDNNPDLKKETPQNLKKYRHTRFYEPGSKTLHFGYYDLPKDCEKLTHGVKSLPSDHVIDCIKDDDCVGTKFFLNQIKEQHYGSNLIKPIGHSKVRNYIFPEQVKKNDFKFGKIYKDFNNAKDIIYNGVALTEPNEEIRKRNHDMYKKSHRVTDIGEQENRHYNWGFDVKEHLFGKPQVIEKDGVKKSLNYDENCRIKGDNDTINNINNINNVNSTNKSLTYRNKFKINNLPILDTDIIFGKKYKRTINKNNINEPDNEEEDKWNVAKCIYGDPKNINNFHLETDPDLGRSWKYNDKIFRSLQLDYDRNKVFGIPTIRRDLPKRPIPSFSDTINYGDQGDAYELLYPHPCSIRGVDDEDFDKLYSKDEIKTFMDENKKVIPKNEFDMIWEIAMKQYPNENGKISIGNFMATMRGIKNEYMVFRMKDKKI